MMKITINNIFLASICMLLSNILCSQGLIEVPLSTNHVLLQKWNEIKNQKSVYVAPSVYDTLNIDSSPFLDDFSKRGPFPDTALWLDNYVFINRDYPIAPPTIGVATFDGVNEHGYPYDFLASQYSTGKADVLTSKRINLKNKVAGDSIYLSFYYQPQGRGNAPESADSLILEFGKKTTAYKTIHDTTFVKDTLFSYDSVTFTDTIVSISDAIGQVVDYVKPYDSVIWQERWAHFGYPLPANDSSWKYVILPVTDTAFLKAGFQFRFRNWATLSGNGDQWSIDNVYLAKNRNMYDTLFEDVAFVYDPPSLLKTYTTMPWRHYKTTFMQDSIHVLLRNNYNVPKNVNFDFCVYDGNNNTVFCSPNSSDNVNSYTSSEYYTYNANPLPVIPALLDSMTYSFEGVLNSNPDKNHLNDTVRTKQKFLNYYAYDDGSAESAFALGGTSMILGELAQQFTSTIPDTLRCIDIYFNPLWNDASLYTIVMKVWNDIGGQPGAEIYSDDINLQLTPEYDTINYGPDHFIRYYLTNPVYFNNIHPLPASTFYVGFLQNTNQFLNVGVDKRTNNMNKVFYNTTGTWYTSPYPGSMMMRAVFGTAAEFTGIKNIPVADKNISVYPNPANDKLFIKINSSNQSAKITYSITDIYGSLISENRINAVESIDISNLSEGIYFITIKDETTISTNRFIKIK